MSPIDIALKSLFKVHAESATTVKSRSKKEPELVLRFELFIWSSFFGISYTLNNNDQFLSKRSQIQPANGYLMSAGATCCRWTRVLHWLFTDEAQPDCTEPPTSLSELELFDCSTQVAGVFTSLNTLNSCYGVKNDWCSTTSKGMLAHLCH